MRTKERALAGAREMVRREGGSEVRVVNAAGKIVRATRIAGNWPNSSRRSTA